MRTTVTLDTDVERMLKEEMHRSRRSFKETLNDVVRSGLSHNPAKRGRVVIEAKPMGLRAGLDPAGLNKLADDLEAEAFLEKTRRLEER